MKVLCIYLAVMNIAAFTAMTMDKIRAVRHRWRIPELTLLLLAAFGGSAGALAGMCLLRHKIRSKKFLVGLPSFLILHLLLAFVYMVWVR